MTVPHEETDQRYYPMLAFEGESAVTSLREAWGVYRALPPEIRKKLMSSGLPARLRSLAEDFSVKNDDVIKMTSVIRELFFNRKTVAQAAEEIAAFSGGDKGKIAEFIEKNILTVQPDAETVPVAAEESAPVFSEKLPLLAALGKYRGLSEQVITQEKIRIKGQPEPVRPTLVNWLRAYRDELGIGYHDPVLRAKFLFNSPNVKKLSSDERERLNLILRSVEDNVPVDIDIRKMEIAFPSFSIGQRGQKEQREQRDPFPRPAPSSSPASPVKPLPATPERPKSLLETFQSVPVSSPIPRAVEPPLAPKRQDTQTQAALKASAPESVPISSAPKKEVATVQEAGFRVGKGMHFMSLEQKAVPPKPEQNPDAISATPAAPLSDPFSFSSKHTFQAEHGNVEKFSINKPTGTTLPSGASFAGPPKSAAEPASPRPLSPPQATGVPVSPAQPSENPMNPFRIHPVSLHGKTGEKDMGRIVDLRNN